MTTMSTRTRTRSFLASALAIGALAFTACAPETPTDPTGTTTTTVSPTTTAAPCGTYNGGPATASVTTSTSTVGGTITLTGSNWLHPTNGGSTIAVKIDEGAFSHLTGQGVHPNLTVWQLVEVDCTGSFSAVIQLPTASNSTPAFTAGAHSFRLLTGSIKAGDAVRTVGPINFTVS